MALKKSVFHKTDSTSESCVCVRMCVFACLCVCIICVCVLGSCVWWGNGVSSKVGGAGGHVVGYQGRGPKGLAEAEASD